MVDDRSLQEQLVAKFGGRFHLSALIQKRMQELKGGATPMVDFHGDDLLSLVMKEIEQGKINLAEGDEDA